jgi:hypothetical protein
MFIYIFSISKKFSISMPDIKKTFSVEVQSQKVVYFFFVWVEYTAYLSQYLATLQPVQVLRVSLSPHSRLQDQHSWEQP